MTTEVNDKLYKRSEGSVWIQPAGPGTKFVYLNCAGMEGYQQNQGDVTLRYCKDPAQAGRFKVVDSYQGERGPVTSTIALPLGRAANYALSLKCPINLQVRYTDCGRNDDPTGWQKILHFHQAKITQKSSQALVARNQSEEGEVLTQAAISAEDLFEIDRVNVNRISVSETAALNDVAFLNESQCASNCGPNQDGCVYGFFAADTGVYPATANVLFTDDGANIAETSADPFAASENISSVVLNGDRVIVARGTADAGNPAEVAYSDDEGTTWTNVNVGSVNGQYINRLVWLSKPYLWAVTNDGYVYFSDDSGLSWTAQTSGTVTAQALKDIDFSDNRNGVAVGAANAVIVTEDGGITWTALTGPAPATVLNTVDMLSSSTFWIGAADGEAYVTTDGGDTFDTSAFTNHGTGSVADIEFADNNFGYMLWNSASPVGKVLRTIDGGATWEVLDTPTNTGLNRLNVCDQNNAYVAGEAQGGTAVVLKVS